MDTEFKFRLRESMDKAGINATELSNLSGVNKSDISNYLKGRYVPKQDKCYYLARALNVEPGWLMIGVVQHKEKVDDDVILLYQSLSEENKQKARSYLEFLKSQEEIK